MCDPFSAMLMIGAGTFAANKIGQDEAEVQAKRAAEESKAKADKEAARQKAEMESEKKRLATEQQKAQELSDYNAKVSQLDQDARERDETSKLAQAIRRNKRPATAEYGTILGFPEETTGKTLLGA